MPRLARLLRKTFFWLGGALAVLAILLWLATRTTAPAVPEGVRKVTHTVELTGVKVHVDLYWPKDAKAAPLAIVAHGFSRSRHNMTGWGGRLAQEGFIAAVLDQPWYLAHVRNGRAICELVDHLRSGKLDPEIRPGPKTVLIGMSMGGLTTLLAANRQAVDAWVGLDPVDVSGGGVVAASELRMPAAIFCAQPATWNWDGNPLKIQKAFPIPAFTLQIKGSTHCDSEWPHDLLGQIACGRTDEARRSTYEDYVVAFLRARIFHDMAAEKTLQAAQADPRVTDLSSRPPAIAPVPANH